MGLILIADNSASERQRLRQIIEQENHIVVEADNSSYCLEIIEVHNLDAVLLNLFLSGTQEVELELLRALQKREIPAIAIIQDKDPQVHQNYFDSGVFAILDEFPSPKKIQGTLAAALGLKPLPKSASENQTSQTLAKEKKSNLETYLSINSFENLVVLGIEEAQATLNELTDSPIEFQTPKLENLTSQSLEKRLQEVFGSEPISVAQLPFKGGFAGISQLFFMTASADALTEALTGEEPGSEDFDQAKEEMLTEVGNIVLNGIMGTMSNAITKSLEYSVPSYIEETIDNILRSHNFEDHGKILFARAGFAIKELQVTGDIILFFQVD